MKKLYIYRPGWERHAIALTYAGTHHIKNIQAKFCPRKILYDMLFPALLIDSFTELLIMLLTLSKCSVCLDWTFYLVFFCHKVTFVFSHTYYLKHSSIHTAWNALQGFLLFVYGHYNFVYQSDFAFYIDLV